MIRHDQRVEVRQRCRAMRLLHLGHEQEQVPQGAAVQIVNVYKYVVQSVDCASFVSFVLIFFTQAISKITFGDSFHGSLHESNWIGILSDG